MDADRNLLVGIVAVQMNFCSRDELIAAMNAWLLEKQRPLAEVLPLPAERRRLLEALVAEHLKLHDGDAQKSLAALGADELLSTGTRQQFAGTGTLKQPERPEGVRFRILRPHAKGGLGEVFVAEDRELRRQVALKEIQQRHADNLNSRGRFVLEAEVTGGLEHPNIVPVYGLGTYADGRPFYAMRFIRGNSLKEAIERYHAAPAPMLFRDLLKRFVDVCNAVAYAHSRGILHRDLKPGNVMLGKYGETLVVDWGLAKSMVSGEREPPESGETALVMTSGTYDETLAGSAIGTPPFMSPEQASGQLDRLGPASDVYSLGATLYVILTGRQPFEGSVGEILRRVAAGEFLAPRAVNTAVPAALNAIVLKAMAKDPSERYASATRLAEEVEHYLADEPVDAFAEPLSVRARRWARKHPGPVAGLAAALLVGMMGAAIAAVLVGGKNRDLAWTNSKLDGANVDLQRSNADLGGIL